MRTRGMSVTASSRLGIDGHRAHTPLHSLRATVHRPGSRSGTCASVWSVSIPPRSALPTERAPQKKSGECSSLVSGSQCSVVAKCSVAGARIGMRARLGMPISAHPGMHVSACASRMQHLGLHVSACASQHAGLYLRIGMRASACTSLHARLVHITRGTHGIQNPQQSAQEAVPVSVRLLSSSRHGAHQQPPSPGQAPAAVPAAQHGCHAGQPSSVTGSLNPHSPMLGRAARGPTPQHGWALQNAS